MNPTNLSNLSKPSQSVHGVVFDFDGVLANSEEIHLRSFRAVFAARGWPLDEARYYERYLGCGDDDLVRVYSDDHGLALDAAARRSLLDQKNIAYRREIQAGTVLYPAAAAVVRAVAARYPLAIASGSRRDEIAHILAAAGLADAFIAVVSADDVTRTKPAPEPYLTAAAHLGIAPSLCLAIEDSSSGLASARAAGLRTIGVTTNSPASKLAAAERILARIEDVTVDVIESIFASEP